MSGINRAKGSSRPNVRVQTPASASRSPVPKVFKVFADPHVTIKTPTRFEGEVIGHWFCPLHSAALWLLEHGLASRSDTIETWRKGAGGQTISWSRSTIDRASRLHVIEGEAIYTGGEWEARRGSRAVLAAGSVSQ